MRKGSSQSWGPYQVKSHPQPNPGDSGVSVTPSGIQVTSKQRSWAFVLPDQSSVAVGLWVEEWCMSTPSLFKPTKKMGSNSQQQFSEGDRYKLLATKYTEARKGHKAGKRSPTASPPLEIQVAVIIGVGITQCKEHRYDFATRNNSTVHIFRLKSFFIRIT